MGKRAGKARGRGGNRNDWDETSSGGFQQSGEMSGSPQNQRGGGKQRKGRNAPGGFGKGAFNNGTGGAFNNGTDGAFNNGTDGAFNNGTDGGFNNGSGFDGGFSKLGGNGFNTEDYSVNDEQKHQEFQDVPNPFGGSGDCQPVIRSRSSSIATNEVNNFGGFGGSVPCRQGSRSRQSSVCRGGEENEIDIADQDLEEKLNFGGSRHSIASRRMSVGSRNEFGTGSSRLSLNSRALGTSSRNVPGQSLADLNGAANFGGTGFNEGFERFSKHHASVRSVQHDEHSGTHRLSKLSINTNADEFVLVGGHPPGGVDGRGSVHSTRSVQSRMSLRRSTDYLAGGHDNIGNGEPLRPASALSRQSEEGDVICESGSDGGEEVFVDAHQNLHCDTTTVPTIMLNSRPLSACSKVSVHSGYDVDNVGTSPDYVTAAGGNSRSRTSSRRSENGFGGEEAGQFGGSRNDFGEQDQLSTGRRSTHASRQSMNAGGFGGEEVGQFGGSRNDFGEQDQLSTGRRSTHASRQSMNAGGFGGEEAGQFGGSRNDFGEQDQLSTGRRSTHASRQSMFSGAGLGNDTDEHLMVAQFNSKQESHQDLRQSVHDVAGSRISIVTPPDVLTRAGSRVSMGGRVELGMSSSKEGRGRNLSERQTQPRSRTVSCSSHADREAVDFAAVPELYSHPDDRFDSQEEGEPFRPTREHEKTPPAAARATTSNDADLNQEIVIGTSEHTAPQPPIPRSRTVSRSSLSQDAPTAVSRNPSMRSVTGVAAPMISTNALTPLSSRNDCNVDPSPLMHDQNQTQVDRRKLESRIHHQLKPKVCSEIGIQTGDTIRLRQGTDSGTLESLAAQPAPVEERVKMAQFGRTRPSFNNSFERKEHPAASVLTSMLQRRTDSSQSSCQSSSLSSQQVTIIHNNQQDNQVRQESLQQQNVHQYETRTQQNWSSNTRSHWQPASNEVGQDEIVVPVELQQHQWTTEQSKHILPREAAEQMRQQVIQESRTQTTPKSSRASRSAEDFESHAQVRKETTAAPNINWRTERNSSQRSGVTKMNGSQNSQFKWTVNDPRDSLVREPDAKWVASLEKEPGRTVRQNVPVGKIRDIASMFNTMQNKAEKEAAVLVMKSKKGLVRRERRQSEPSLNGSMVEYQETRYTSRPQDPRYYKEQHSNFHSREEPVNGLQNQVSRGRAGVWDHSDWNCENDLNGALLDVNDDSDRDSRVDLRRTSTPLSGHFDHREAMAAKFHRVPSIRAEAHHVVTRQSRPSQRGEVRSIAASFERSASNSPPSQQRDVRRPSSVVQRPPYHNQYSQEISEGVPRTSQRDSERSHLSRQNSIHHRRSYSMQPVKRQMEVDFSAEEESPYAQVSRGNSQQPRELASRDYGGAGDYASLASNQQRQSLSRFDDIAEENVIGHIDNLFDFVQDHEAPVDGGRPVCIPLNKPPPPPKMPLNYSVSAYREIQRHNRIPNEQAPVRFSPSVAPNIGELSHINRSAHHHKQSFNQASMQSVRSQFGGCPADLVTSTPRESPRLAKKTAGYSAQDASFVSSITEGSQRMENHIDYKKQANKLSHHIEINREQIGMTEKVLSQARKEKKPLQELSAQRTLLVARERVALLDRELKRVLALSQAKHKPPPLNQDLRGCMDISNITVQLNRNFCQRHNDLNSSYAFVVLLKCGSEVEATAPVTLLAMASHQHRLRQVHFAEKVNFGNIPVDFNVQVEVYTMVLPDRRSEESSCATTIANKCRSLLVPARRPIRSANGLPVGEFVRCGYLQLNRDTTGCSKFYLDEAEYPLEGTMEVHTRCTTLPPSIEVDYRSFLTMYQCISGIGSWERYWAVLRRGMVYFWKYPEDESMNRAPKAHLDLASCTRDELAPCTPEQCPRPYSFCVDVLVATAPSVMDRKRVLLSADSRDMMNAWLDAMNETLSIIRG